MNSKQLTNILQQDFYTRKINGKVISLDQVPKHVSSFPSWFIINDETSSLPGSHWVAIFFTKINEPADFFDSLGNLPSNYGKILPNC
jgi:hypothetical protein